MKIDKKKPAHWWYLFLFAVNVLAGLVVRPFVSRNRTVVLYGHKLHGNLKPIYTFINSDAGIGFDVVYLTLSPDYYRALRRAGVNVRLATNPAHMLEVCRASAIVTDHGVHALYFLLFMSDIVFVDVWHGIPFKGFDDRDFRVQQRYRAVLVASSSMRDMYLQKYGFTEQQVVVTGYARTDQLVRPDSCRDHWRGKYGLPTGTKTVLVAPTWHHEKGVQQAQANRFPANDTLRMLTDFASDKRCSVVFRQHLNSPALDAGAGAGVRFMSLDQYPQTEELLLAADVLVTDWSSIAFDYLLLRRPVIFLDTPAPFAKGFSYGPEFRYGAIVSDVEDLRATLARAVEDEDAFLAGMEKKMLEVTDEVYGRWADGGATSRSVAAIADCAGLSRPQPVAHEI